MHKHQWESLSANTELRSVQVSWKENKYVLSFVLQADLQTFHIERLLICK